MPLTVFNAVGVAANRRERIESAVEAGSKHLSVSYEAWIAADPFRGGMRVLITGPQGFDRVVQFDTDEQAAEITRGVRERTSDASCGRVQTSRGNAYAEPWASHY